MCNLVGTWRILQRIGSHRWTTDDIVTAYIAKQTLFTIKNGKDYTTSTTTSTTTPTTTTTSTTINKANNNEIIHYLDLGCGNASVLSMVYWSLNHVYDKIQAFGIEARKEAVQLATRSLSFNIGLDKIGKRITLINADFRVLHEDLNENLNDNGGENRMDHNNNIMSNSSGVLGDVDESNCSSNNSAVTVGIQGAIDKSGMEAFYQVKKQKFDLVTGTPPYFRVDFKTESSNPSSSSSGNSGNSDRVVTSAVIRQGYVLRFCRMKRWQGFVCMIYIFCIRSTF